MSSDKPWLDLRSGAFIGTISLCDCCRGTPPVDYSAASANCGLVLPIEETGSMTVRHNEQRTRTLILRSAFEIVCIYGFAGVTLGNLARHIGMSKSGLFAHFKSIEQLHRELIDHIGDVFRLEVVSPALDAPEGLPRLEATVSNWLIWASRPTTLGGSPLLAGFFEFDDREGSIRDSLLKQAVGWCTYLRQLADHAVALGDFRKDLDCEQFVFELCGIYFSFHVSERFMRHPGSRAFATVAVNELVNRARRR
jgi:AcrR family transcriptional regulator